MRIIGGSLRGRILSLPQGFTARPTTDYAREALMDVIDSAYEFDGLKVLDLFGGSGAVSFEFCSRGVGHVWCVEMNPQYASAISLQASRLGIRNLSVVRHNVFEFLPLCTQKFDLIFADPPYALNGLETLPDRIFERDILNPGCWFVLEHGDEHSFREHPYFLKEKRYGRVHFSFFERA